MRKRTFIVHKEFINKHNIIINKDYIYIGLLTDNEINSITTNIKVLYEVLHINNNLCIIVI